MRGPRISRAARAAMATAAIALAILPSQVAAALLWTLTASPLTATTGVPTTFTLVGTNGDPLNQIGCIRVTVPSATVIGASIVSASNGRTWLASVHGNTIWVQSQDGGGRLALLQSVTFKIQATISAPGAYTWNSNAYARQDCAGTGSLLGVPPVVVVSGTAPTPSPTPTPTPTPTPRPASPSPTPAPIASLPVPSVPVPSLPAPSLPPAPSASSSPAASLPVPSVAVPSSSASPTGTPASSSGPNSGGSGPSPGGGGSGGSAAGGNGPGSLGVRTTPTGSGDLNVGGLGTIDAFGLWLVPGTVIAGPGLLAIIWLLIQVLAGLAWLPAARRMRGREDARQRRPAISR